SRDPSWRVRQPPTPHRQPWKRHRSWEPRPSRAPSPSERPSWPSRWPRRRLRNPSARPGHPTPRRSTARPSPRRRQPSAWQAAPCWSGPGPWLSHVRASSPLLGRLLLTRGDGLFGSVGFLRLISLFGLLSRFGLRLGTVLGRLRLLASVGLSVSLGLELLLGALGLVPGIRDLVLRARLVGLG